MPEEVESEVKHVLRIFKDILIIPFLPLLIPMKKKSFADFFRPLGSFWKFFWDAKFVAIMILINIVVFFGLIAYGMSTGAQGFDDLLEQNPTINNLFINRADDILHPFSQRFLSIFFAGFMHASLGHLVGNMLFLFALGRVVERKLGFGKTMLVYFLAIIAASITTNIFDLAFGDPASLGLGASGGISGLGAAAMILAPLSITFVFFFPLPVVVVVFSSLISDLAGARDALGGAESGVGYFAHLGGFFLTIPLMFLLCKEEREEMKKRMIITIVLVGLVVAARYLIINGIINVPFLGE